MPLLRDQKLIFVIFKTGFSGHFVSTLLQNIEDAVDAVVANGGHCHFNKFRTRSTLDLKTSITIRNSWEEKITDKTVSDLKETQVPADQTYIFPSHAANFDKLASISNNYKFVVITYPPELYTIGRISGILKRHYYDKWSRLLGIDDIIKTIPMLGLDEQTSLAAFKYAINNIENDQTLVEALMSRHVQYTSNITDGYTIDDLPDIPNIIELPFKVIVDADVDKMCDIISEIYDAPLTDSQRQYVSGNLTRYRAAQHSTLWGSPSEFLRRILFDQDKIRNELICSAPWNSPTVSNEKYTHYTPLVAHLNEFAELQEHPSIVLAIRAYLLNNNRWLYDRIQLISDQIVPTSVVNKWANLCKLNELLRGTESNTIICHDLQTVRSIVHSIDNIKVVLPIINEVLWANQLMIGFLPSVLEFNSLDTTLNDVLSYFLRDFENITTVMEYLKDSRDDDGIMKMLLYSSYDFFTNHGVTYTPTSRENYNDIDIDKNSIVEMPTYMSDVSDIIAKLEQLLDTKLTSEQIDKVTQIVDVYCSLFPDNFLTNPELFFQEIQATAKKTLQMLKDTQPWKNT